jgi:hypothetical protein
MYSPTKCEAHLQPSRRVGVAVEVLQAQLVPGARGKHLISLSCNPPYKPGNNKKACDARVEARCAKPGSFRRRGAWILMPTKAARFVRFCDAF